MENNIQDLLNTINEICKGLVEVVELPPVAKLLSAGLGIVSNIYEEIKEHPKAIGFTFGAAIVLVKLPKIFHALGDWIADLKIGCDDIKNAVRTPVEQLRKIMKDASTQMDPGGPGGGDENGLEFQGFKPEYFRLSKD